MDKSTAAQQGYVALMTALILSFILVGFTIVVSNSGFFSRFNSQDFELKRVSLGLAESCVHAALLKLVQNYNYTPAVGGDTVAVGAQNCSIESISFTAPVNNKKIATVLTSANFGGAFSNVEVKATLQDPSVSPLLTPSSPLLPPNISVNSWEEKP